MKYDLEDVYGSFYELNLPDLQDGRDWQLDAIEIVTVKSVSKTPGISRMSLGKRDMT